LAKKHEVFLCCLDDSNTPQSSIDHLKNICQHVEVLKLRRINIYFNLIKGLFSSLPFQVWYFYQASAHKKVKKIIANFKPDHIYTQLVRTTEYVKNEHAIAKTLDYQDTFSKGIA
jgi:hypothetical protein